MAAILAVAWGVRALLEGRLFPPQRPWNVSWTGWEILLLVFLIQIVWPFVIAQTLRRAGVLDHIYGPPPTAVSAEEGTEAAKEQTDAELLRRSRQGLWLYAAMFPFQMLTIIVILWQFSGTRPRQLGLTTRDFGQNLGLGFLGWLIFAPPVLFLNL